jgi:hypothetical protein
MSICINIFNKSEFLDFIIMSAAESSDVKIYYDKNIFCFIAS